MAIDPVCKMEVDEKTAKIKTEYKKGKHITSVHRDAKRHLRISLKSILDSKSIPYRELR